MICAIISRQKLREEIVNNAIVMEKPGTVESSMVVQNDLMREIRELQTSDKFLNDKLKNEPSKFAKKDGLICYEKRVCVPQKKEILRKILSEAHDTPYSIHPGGDKMYKDLK